MNENLKDAKLDGIVDSLLLFFPLFYRKILRVAHSKARINPANMQYHVMAMLAQWGTMQTSEIGLRLGISRPNITSLLDKLIEKGYVQRLHDSRDKRVIRVVVTDRGRRFVNNRQRIIRREIKKNLSTLGIEELMTLSASVNTFKDIVSQVGDGS